MKRYWKLISLTTAIVLVIGIFYIQSVSATNSYPSFVIKTEKGNKDELNGIAIDGTYHHQNYSVREGVRISENGTEYNSDISVIDYLFGYFNNDEIKRLQEEYRSFMRGKWRSLSSFYEDDKLLAYADVTSDRYGYRNAEEFTFTIDILNKDTNETFAFQMDAPNKDGFYYMDVEDVQVVGKELKVFTNNRGNEKIENHVYSFDIQTGNLIEEEVLVSEEENMGTDGWTDLYILNSYQDIRKNEYVVYKVMETEHFESEQYPYGYEKQTIDRFVSYHVETGEINEFKLEELDFLSNQMSPFQDTSLITDSTAYFSTVTENGIEIYPYSLKEGRVGEPSVVELELQPETMPLVKMSNERLYMVDWMSNKDTGASIEIADIKTGEILYQGIIEIENKQEEPLEYEFYINDIIFE